MQQEEQHPTCDLVAAESAAAAGALDHLHYIHDHGSDWNVSEICEHAARGGSLACLHYARTTGCPITDDVIIAAVRGRNPDCCIIYK
jgi:hypothetical protein